MSRLALLGIVLLSSSFFTIAGSERQANAPRKQSKNAKGTPQKVASPKGLTPNSSAEIKAIEMTLNGYIEGSTGGQPEKLRRVFHPDLNLYYVRKNEIRVWQGKDYIGETKPGKPTGEKGRILAIDFENDCAVAKVEIAPPQGERYIDYFLLLKTKEEWKIVHKAFTKRRSTAAATSGDWSNSSIAPSFEPPVDKGQAGPPSQFKNSSTTWQNLPDRMEKIANEMLASQHLPGLAVAVVRDGKTIFCQGFGFADIAKKRPVDPDQTIFRIGSISKALTLLTLTRQIDQGVISRNDDVETWIDSIDTPNHIRSPITVDHLLTHTTGLDQIGAARQVTDWHLSWDQRQAKRKSLGLFLRNNNLRRIETPGRTYRYDTYGTSLAGHILEQLQSCSYPEAMKKEMFDQLGMSRTSVEVKQQDRQDLAVGYGVTDGQYTPRPYEFYKTTPASSIDSTVRDMSRLLQALTSDGGNAHGRLFSPEMLKQITSQHFRVHPDFCGVSHGLFESWTSDEGTRDLRLRSLGHGGDMDGYRAALTLIPSHNVGIFVATNRSPSGGGGDVDLRPLIDVVLDSIPDASFRMAEKETDGLSKPIQLNLNEYSGDYYYGMFCHTMSPRDQDRGAWRRGSPVPVQVVGNTLKIRNEVYSPTAQDLFVESTGKRHVKFHRNQEGSIDSFTYSTSPDTFERPQPDYQVYPSLAQRFFELASAGELTQANELCQRELTQRRHYIREAEFNNAGNALWQNERFPAAIAAFRFNTNQFPKSWKAHDRLAAAFAKLGQTREAIASYNRSLKLNPQNHKARKRIEELKE